MSFEQEEISLKQDKSLTRADVENLLKQQGESKSLNLSGLNLSVINFSNMDLSGAAFAYANMNGANLLEANLEYTSLNSARLNGVKGHGVRLDDADLGNASLIEAKLDEASFARAHLNKTNLSGADLRRVIMTGTNLESANLSEADLTGANLAGANLSQANLSRAILRDTDLSNADLRGAVLGGAKLDGAKLDGANLSQVRMLLANLHKARLSQAILNQTEFNWSDLSGADLTGADLTGAKLIEADLSGADLRDATLNHANLSGANLSEARMVGADLQDVNLSGATLNGAYLSDEQKEMLASYGQVLGLDETRSAQDLSDLEESLRLLEEVDHTNGVIAEDELSDLRLFGQTDADLEASAFLPSLDASTGLEDLSSPDYAETELPPLFSDPRPESYSEVAPNFVGAPTSTVSLVVKETPLPVTGLALLLGSLDRLSAGLNFIRQEKFAELVEFYRSQDAGPAQECSLLVKSFDAATGQIELTAKDTSALPALTSVLAGISQQSEETTAQELAENTLENFSPYLDPVVKGIAARALVENIRQLAAGLQFYLAGGTSDNPVLD